MTRKVVLCTDKRGVFFGTIDDDVNVNTPAVTMRDAQMALYWSKATRGMMGLASHGPADGSRITRPVPSIELNGITAIVPATDEAAARWTKMGNEPMPD